MKNHSKVKVTQKITHKTSFKNSPVRHKKKHLNLKNHSEKTLKILLKKQNTFNKSLDVKITHKNHSKKITHESPDFGSKKKSLTKVQILGRKKKSLKSQDFAAPPPPKSRFWVR